jgi:DNA polymerase-3 subunit gamma/tau
MSYIVLARKYRPQTFSEVYAQDHVTEILQNAIQSERIAHAFLFTGPRGVGKTSMARILAKSLNCVEGPTITPCNVCHNCVEITSGTSADVIEIDGASNTGVDDIRELQRELLYAPSQSKYKIYIIDEVHMLSKNAFNALLKTLEEPPENVLFIFATTEPQKVIPTIISRCQRYDFKRIPVEAIVRRLRELSKEEGIEIDNESLYLIARKADGGMRDALSLMDQVLSYCMNNVTIDKVREIFGLIPNQVFNDLLAQIHARDSQALIMSMHELFEQGTDLQELITNMLEFLRIVLLRKLGIEPGDVNKEEYPLYDEPAGMFAQNTLMYIMSLLMQARGDMKTSTNPYLILEMAMIKLSQMEDMQDIATLLDIIKRNPAPQGTGPTIHSQPAPIRQTAPKPADPVVHEEPAFSRAELNAANLATQWDRLINRIRKVSSVSALAFKAARVVSAENGVLTLEIISRSNFDALKSRADEIEKQLAEVFSDPVRLVLKYMEQEPPSKVQINRRTIEDVKAMDPQIARLIEITDSKLGAGS